MAWKAGWWADLRTVQFNEATRTSWIHAMRPGTYEHAGYGKLEFTADRLQRFADSVVKRVRGIDPDVDYDHKMDMAMGGAAAGWVKGAQTRADGLWLLVEWTEKAFQQIKDKAYRYFSPEFAESWTDASGTTHHDVLTGGGITNRPFLKDLVPLNLSELTFNSPEPPTPPTSQEDDVDMKKLRESLGLAEGTSDEDVWKKFTERQEMLAKLSENPQIIALLTPTPPNPNDPPVTPPAPPAPQPTIQLSEELKKLSEANPVVKSLLEAFEAQTRTHANMTQQLRESEVTTKLSELDKSKLVITPAAKDLIHDIAIQLTDNALSEKFWQLMHAMHTSQSFLVELGERTGTGVKFGRDKSAVQQFNEATAALVTGGMSYPDAIEQVARDNRDLYEQYRSESTSFRA